MKKLMTLLATLVLVGGLFCGNAYSLTLSFYPDIYVELGGLTFDTTEMTASGDAQLYKKGPSDADSIWWDFSLNASFNDNTITSGEFTLYDGSSLMLSGDLTSFTIALDIYSFLFTPTGGKEFLNGPFNVSQGGINLATGNKTLDIGIPAPVPEPSTWMLLAAGLGLLAARRRRLK